MSRSPHERSDMWGSFWMSLRSSGRRTPLLVQPHVLHARRQRKLVLAGARLARLTGGDLVHQHRAELRAVAVGAKGLHDRLVRAHRRHVDQHAPVDGALGVEQHEIELEALERGLALVLDYEGQTAAVLGI